eukprot:12744557-Alexandrium_andersonii.AAC.1
MPRPCTAPPAMPPVFVLRARRPRRRPTPPAMPLGMAHAARPPSLVGMHVRRHRPCMAPPATAPVLLGLRARHPIPRPAPSAMPRPCIAPPAMTLVPPGRGL